MKKIDAFFPLVAGRINGCPTIMLTEAIRDACIDFCKRTRMLIIDDFIDVRSGERVIELYPPDGVTYSVDALRRDNVSLLQSSRHDFARSHLDIDTGAPSAYYLESDRTLVVGPIPDANEMLSCRFVVRPSDTATSVSTALYSDWREPIAAGARAYLRRNYSSWADSAEESADRELYESAVYRANHARAKGGTNQRLRAKAHFF